MSDAVIKYRKGYKYQLAEEYGVDIPILPPSPIEAEYISLSTSGRLTIKNGYAWDGASGPTIDTPNAMRGPLVHDALYQLIREGFLPMDFRQNADDVLEQLCDEDSKIIAARSNDFFSPFILASQRVRFKVWKWAVKNFAKGAAEWENERPIITAP